MVFCTSVITDARDVFSDSIYDQSASEVVLATLAIQKTKGEAKERAIFATGVTAAWKSWAFPVMSKPTVRVIGLVRNCWSEQGENGRTYKSEKAKNAAKDLDNKNLYKKIWICGICQCCSRAGNAYANTAKEVACTDSETTPEQRKTWK